MSTMRRSLRGSGFNPYDLYSKGRERPDMKGVLPFYWGKPAVRHSREGDGNDGIIRSPFRAIALPDREAPGDNLQPARGFGICKKANTSSIFEFAVNLLRLKYGFDSVGATNLIPIILLCAG